MIIAPVAGDHRMSAFGYTGYKLIFTYSLLPTVYRSIGFQPGKHFFE